MSEIHLNRFNKLIDFVKNQPEESFELKRKEIAKIVGVSEGDSLKKIFKILNDNKEIYNKIFSYKKEGNTHSFKKIKKIVNPSIEKLHLNLKEEITKCAKILNNIKKLSEDDYEFCKNEFKNNFLFISLFLKTDFKNINIPNELEYIKHLNKKIEEINLMYNTLKLYYIISA